MAEIGSVRGIVNMQMSRTEAESLFNALGELADKNDHVTAIEEKMAQILVRDAA